MNFLAQFSFDDPNLLMLLGTIAALGIVSGWWINALLSRRKHAEIKSQLEQHYQQTQGYVQQQILDLKEALHTSTSENTQLRQVQLSQQNELGQLTQQVARIPVLEQDSKRWQGHYQQIQQHASDLREELAEKTARFEQEKLASDEKLALLESSEQRLQQQFENLANKIFEQKNNSFQQSSKAGLDALLNPLKDQIEGFKKQVSDQYVREGQERASLKTEILGLKELNRQITQDAAALTKALKGDNKQQGNWGEVVLERVLKESGLREGHEFDTQVALKNDSGKSYQPDVVVHLPNDKDVVIDSKVSLAAYERYFNEEHEESRQVYLNQHVASLRNHIKELGNKDYQDLKGLRSLDYVLMFIPIEPAFLLAAEHAPELVKLAFDNNIMLVSPTNLLVALRTINNIWQYEYQNQNAQKIAANAGKLYDKFHGFVSDMEKVGKSMESTQRNYDAAMNKLTTGKGNLIRQAEQFKALGVQSNKKLDARLLQEDDIELPDDDHPEHTDNLLSEAPGQNDEKLS
ncbi:DNA recombination protein RmuC [Paraglaciecola agarilytica]|uniref:DNA recombination protein RmuC n=1 Tax=Paraglaciecola chathamensis TaxID=368405 RepID=UPI001C093C1B|nr:DNA recombination protein RmuC [Paraglaciecola agarilytica]MBU3016413.1 DNA recombination protein RmuC [Paraglaciecola agarilytica]